MLIIRKMRILSRYFMFILIKRFLHNRLLLHRNSIIIRNKFPLSQSLSTCSNFYSVYGIMPVRRYISFNTSCTAVFKFVNWWWTWTWFYVSVFAYSRKGLSSFIYFILLPSPSQFINLFRSSSILYKHVLNNNEEREERRLSERLRDMRWTSFRINRFGFVLII